MMMLEIPHAEEMGLRWGQIPFGWGSIVTPFPRCLVLALCQSSDARWPVQ
jgi:hypothetical protein